MMHGQLYVKKFRIIKTDYCCFVILSL